MHHYAPVEALADPQQRAACQARHLAAGHRLLLERHRLGSIQQVVALVEEYC
jgi:5-methylthioribose kinase